MTFENYVVEILCKKLCIRVMLNNSHDLTFFLRCLYEILKLIISG